MVFIDILTQSILGIIGLVVFLFGFLLVRKNLAKINKIEGEKFDFSDFMAMFGFGLMFAVAIVFMVNITFEIILPERLPLIAGYLLVIMISVVVIYPLWEVFFLGRPTSDSVHDFHRFLESKILDRFKGKMAYLVSFGIFLVIYILPIFILDLITQQPLIQLTFVWFMVFPLFFLNYFAANGTANGVLSSTFSHTFSKALVRNMPKGQKKKNRVVNWLIMIVAWIPFLLNLYNIYNPLSKVLAGTAELGERNELMGYISLATTIPFGIKGFFKKFWNRKSKTKTIDYLFAAYIFIAIAINMLISFVQIKPTLVVSVLEQVPILSPLVGIFSNYVILLPLIIMQSSVTFFYGMIIIIQTQSDFQADVRLQSTSMAYGMLDLEDLVNRQKSDEELVESGAEKTKKKMKRKKKEKKKKYDFLTLYKSVLLEPSYSKYGVDLNESIRKKAAQYLLLIAIDDKTEAVNIVDLVFKMSIDLASTEKTGKDVGKEVFISKEAINLLGLIGATYQELVLDRLIAALSYSEIYIQREILDALGDIGESKANLQIILEKIQPLFNSERYELRQAAFSAVSEMILEGNSEDKEFVHMVLSPMYTVLSNSENPEVIDSCLEALVKMSARIADDIEFDKIVPFLLYSSTPERDADQDTIDYIVQNTIIVLSYLVYYNVDKITGILFELEKFLKDSRSFVRYAAVDALGNYILKCPDDKKEKILTSLLVISLHDQDPDVTEMCTESIAEFLVMHKGYQITIDGRKISILDYYTHALTSSERSVAENASEALKSISPLYDDDIYPLLAKHIREAANMELVRDCLHVIAISGKEEHLSTELDLIYKLTDHEDASVRAEAIFTLGNLAQHRPELDSEVILNHLEDPDPQTRLQAIFALGKLGPAQPNQIIPLLIQKYFEIDRESDEKVSEVELYAESLGIIGAKFPSNEIIVTLQSTLMGDTNPFAKDVIARALGTIGLGMIGTGNATRTIKNETFYNQISWLKSTKAEYTIGNLIIIFIEALQQKGISESVMNEISDSIQDLLPVFLFTKIKNQRKENEILETIKELLAQAYYTNYNSEILETIDRIDSLISFKRSFEVENPNLQKQFRFYATQYTPDGKQFHDQGELFLLMTQENKDYWEYAFQSFKIAQHLAPNEYFTPNAVFQMGYILFHQEKYELAETKLNEALEIYTSLDDVSKMQIVETFLNKIQEIK